MVKQWDDRTRDGPPANTLTGRDWCSEARRTGHKGFWLKNIVYDEPASEHSHDSDHPMWWTNTNKCIRCMTRNLGCWNMGNIWSCVMCTQANIECSHKTNNQFRKEGNAGRQQCIRLPRNSASVPTTPPRTPPLPTHTVLSPIRPDPERQAAKLAARKLERQGDIIASDDNGDSDEDGYEAGHDSDEKDHHVFLFYHPAEVKAGLDQLLTLLDTRTRPALKEAISVNDEVLCTTLRVDLDDAKKQLAYKLILHQALQAIISDLQAEVVTTGEALRAAKKKQDSVTELLIRWMGTLTLAGSAEPGPTEPGPTEEESESRSHRGSDTASDTSDLLPIVALQDKVMWETHADDDNLGSEDLGDDEDEEDEEEERGEEEDDNDVDFVPDSHEGVTFTNDDYDNEQDWITEHLEEFKKLTYTDKGRWVTKMRVIFFADVHQGKLYPPDCPPTKKKDAAFYECSTDICSNKGFNFHVAFRMMFKKEILQHRDELMNAMMPEEGLTEKNQVDIEKYRVELNTGGLPEPLKRMLTVDLHYSNAQTLLPRILFETQRKVWRLCGVPLVTFGAIPGKLPGSFKVEVFKYGITCNYLDKPFTEMFPNWEWEPLDDNLPE
ncbi:hypothetical protein OF83DRAFT_1087700 [Amylostereum chailletii]|nr:hypothetical protein OF83DRAFT_1087700 [Amylostereum chailletii]